MSVYTGVASPRTAIVNLAAIVALTSCGGGSSGGPPPPPPPPPVVVTETLLYSFVGSNNGATDGSTPSGGPVLDFAGNLYGTTIDGGSGSPALGTLFKLDTSGQETILHSFQQQASDGYDPSSGIVIDSSGTLYATTANGGTGGACVGCGTFFKVDSAGNETILYNFTGQNGDGAHPSGIISDGSGNFYGVTVQGGSAACWCGTVFKVDSSGNEAVVYSFTGQNGDGAFTSWLPGSPGLNLVLDNSGNLYGVTPAGGNSGCLNNSGCGTVFKVDSTGHETVLHVFSGPDGKYPTSLLMDKTGNLYGTAQEGGTSNNCAQLGCGTVFKIDSVGNETTVYSFTGAQNSDGAVPLSLVMDASGNLYGITVLGGPVGSCTSIGGNQISGCGTFFKLDSAGRESVLYNFKGLAGSASGDGLGPETLTTDNAGNFYGTTDSGGVVCTEASNGCGTVFKIALH